jgi:hypothetical protein
MKKLCITALMIVVCYTLHAQYKLSGSAYLQNFDSLSSGLPLGWQVDTNASAASLGNSAIGSFVSAPGVATRWSNVTGAFKNVASANSFTSFAAATSTAQLAATDRALGLKQTATFGDGGAAFTFQIDNTFRLSNFTLDFKLQSLDSSAGSRVSTWQVQYALGTSPTVFTTVGSGTWTTGGNTFSNTFISKAFGAALDDSRVPVWIRIVCLSPATGTGSRATTAIDDVHISWTGTAVPSYRPLLTQVYPLNNATNVPIGSILTVDFNKHIQLGTTGNVYIKNETDNSLQTIAAGSTQLHVSGQQLSIAGVKLDVAKTYHVTFDSSIVDTAGASTFALTDTSAWRFATEARLPYFIVEYFDTACITHSALPAHWTKYSQQGTAEWNCFEHVSGNASMRMYGNDGLVNKANIDWLISPKLDLSAPDAMGISFNLLKYHSGNELTLWYAYDYAGSGDPDSATWTAIPLTMLPKDTAAWHFYNFPIKGFSTMPFYLAFKYQSDSVAAYDVRIDSVMAMIKTSIPHVKTNQNSCYIIGYPHSGQIDLSIAVSAPTQYTLQLRDIFGQSVYHKLIQCQAGKQIYTIQDLALPSGLYFISLMNEQEHLFQKCLIP